MSEIFGIHDEALMLRVKRATVLANNIVNADTPGFKAVDIDFKSAMAQALPNLDHDGQLSMATSESGHMHGLNDPQLGAEFVYRMNVQPTLDGNTVDANVEKAEYMRNSQKLQATLRFLDDRISGIRKAFRGD